VQKPSDESSHEKEDEATVHSGSEGDGSDEDEEEEEEDDMIDSEEYVDPDE